jgi:hypothetical protein
MRKVEYPKFLEGDRYHDVVMVRCNTLITISVVSMLMPMSPLFSMRASST